MGAERGKRRVHTLHAGELVFGKGGYVISTLLGSCVSVTLFHPTKKLAGICHFALPGTASNEREKPDPRYAIDCFQLFKKHADAHQCRLREFHANIIGGGNMLDDPALHAALPVQPSDKAKVGERNALIALKLAHEHRLNIQAVDVGEFGYRKVRFFTDTGDICVSMNNSNSQ